MLLSLQINWLPGINDACFVLPALRTIARQIPYFSALGRHWKESNYPIWLTLNKLSFLWLPGSVQCNYTVAFSGNACLQVPLQPVIIWKAAFFSQLYLIVLVHFGFLNVSWDNKLKTNPDILHQKWLYNYWKSPSLLIKVFFLVFVHMFAEWCILHSDYLIFHYIRIKYLFV